MCVVIRWEVWGSGWVGASERRTLAYPAAGDIHRSVCLCHNENPGEGCLYTGISSHLLFLPLYPSFPWGMVRLLFSSLSLSLHLYSSLPWGIVTPSPPPPPPPFLPVGRTIQRELAGDDTCAPRTVALFIEFEVLDEIGISNRNRAVPAFLLGNRWGSEIV